MPRRPSLFALIAAVALAGCEEKKPDAAPSAGATAPPAGASAGGSAAPAPSPSPAPAPSPSPSAAAPAASQKPLTGNKSLKERLIGSWKTVRPAEQEARFKAELAKAEEELKNAKTPAEKQAAKARKTTVEDLGFSWTEFSKEKRTTKAPPSRMVVERPYEVTKEEGRTITIRVWDATNPRGGFEQYTFVDDNTMTSPRGDSGEVDTYARK